MKIVMTLMVRDEADVISPMIEFHLDQGIDLIIVTDNASVDGTTEILQQYADLGVVELHHDPVHRKQQGTLVTSMARRAFTEHHADWVINADADEFLVPLNRSLTIRDALEATPVSLGAFAVPVVNLVGAPALRGGGFDRLVWRDLRSVDELIAVGIHAQPTPNAIHVGDADVVVAQGNHFVSVPSRGQPDAAVAMEVLHLPWRSWSQFEQKVIQAGRAYEASPNLKPSKNHHGMADYSRARAGRLREAFLLRLPQRLELAHGSFEPDPWLCEHLHKLIGRARFPELLETALDASKDELVPEEIHAAAAAVGAKYLQLERERDAFRDEADELRRTVNRLRKRVRRIREERDRLAKLPVRTDAARLVRRAVAAVKRRIVR